MFKINFSTPGHTVLCVEDVPYDFISLLLDCRLTPLMKEDNGVRPVGIGEALRRIMAKSVMKVLKMDVQLAGRYSANMQWTGRWN